MTKKRVAAYCRVSTAMEEQEGSYETQVSYYRALITSNPEYQLVDVYGDQGASGRTVKRRPEFQRMIGDCETGKIDLILSKSISRFARNLPDCIRTIRHLNALGVGVYFEREGLDTLNPNMELLLNCLAAIAEEESTSIGQNLRWAHDKRNEAGKPNLNRAWKCKGREEGVCTAPIWKEDDLLSQISQLSQTGSEAQVEQGNGSYLIIGKKIEQTA